MVRSAGATALRERAPSTQGSMAITTRLVAACCCVIAAASVSAQQSVLSVSPPASPPDMDLESRRSLAAGNRTALPGEIATTETAARNLAKEPSAGGASPTADAHGSVGVSPVATGVVPCEEPSAGGASPAADAHGSVGVSPVARGVLPKKEDGATGLVPGDGMSGFALIPTPCRECGRAVPRHVLQRRAVVRRVSGMS